mmetsp:Transcript_44075/g.122136  ORF Transcript_44075/g.122136 Transcript_44075/m.122136 type:complete len:256 (-) Transcript_44075:969-1736(-)
MLCSAPTRQSQSSRRVNGASCSGAGHVPVHASSAVTLGPSPRCLPGAPGAPGRARRTLCSILHTTHPALPQPFRRHARRHAGRWNARRHAGCWNARIRREALEAKSPPQQHQPHQPCYRSSTSRATRRRRRLPPRRRASRGSGGGGGGGGAQRRSVLPLPRFPEKRCFGRLEAIRRSDSEARPILLIVNCFFFASLAALTTCASSFSPIFDGERLRAISDESRRVAARLSERPRFEPTAGPSVSIPSPPPAEAAE